MPTFKKRKIKKIEEGFKCRICEHNTCSKIIEVIENLSGGDMDIRKKVSEDECPIEYICDGCSVKFDDINKFTIK